MPQDIGKVKRNVAKMVAQCLTVAIGETIRIPADTTSPDATDSNWG